MTSMMRTEIKGLYLSFILALSIGCGGAPKPDPVAEELARKRAEANARVHGQPRAAVDAFNRGVAALQKKPADYTNAVKEFEDSVAKAPKYVVAALNLAYSYERLGRYQDAARTYQSLIDQKVIDRGVILAYGRALLLSGAEDRAIDAFKKVLAKTPDDLQAKNNLAAAYLAKGDDKRSLIYVKEVLATQPKNVPAIVNLGLLYMKQNKLSLAQLMFDKALGYEKKNARAKNNLGLTFYRLDLIPQAVVAFESAIALDDTMDEARLNVASIYLDYLDYKRALTEFQAVRKRFPTHYQAMIGEADSLYGVGEYQAAADLYEESFTVRQDNPEAYLRVGKIFEEQLNKPEAALGHYISYRDLAKPPATDPIHGTIQFLQQADQMKLQSVGGDEPPALPPAEAEGAVEGAPAPVEGETAPAAEDTQDGGDNTESDASGDEPGEG